MERANGMGGYLRRNGGEREDVDGRALDTDPRLSAILEQLPLGVGLLDVDGRFVVSNSMMRSLVPEPAMPSLDPARMGRWHATDADGRALPPEQWPGKRALRGEVVSPGTEFLHTASDGERRWIMVSAAPFLSASGELLGAIAVAQDVTERRRGEEAIRRSRDDMERLARTLEERVRERTADVEQRGQQLRVLHAELSRAEQRQRKQLAVMLHDGLQQLLVAARIRLGLAQRDAGETAQPTLAEVHDLLEKCIDAARTLTLELAPPLLHDRGLVPALLWLAREMREKHALSVDVRAEEGSEPASDDVRLLLFQATRELLFNVAKHARVETATVSLTREGSRLRLEVSDRGVGFDPGRAREVESFGLLSVEQRVDWLGGSMRVDSAHGEGTRVGLVVPAAPAVHADAVPELAPDSADRTGRASSAPGRLRVLLADDHKIVREGLVSLLAGCPDLEVVAQAADGEEAVALAHRHLPDVVVMDLSMPKLDGIGATRRITAELPAVRVVGLSMYDSGDVADAMRAAGAVGYVRKGGPVEDLIALVRAAGRPNPART